ncbi:hypothetical protein CYY_002008 [Polysphondylium violaceum]|uniref:Uncharacterized protein n=1 Tax=Polysphondylium violaceum TaxID=133409 RepID=A0A8J4V149_9MYCE|nr:hypothetical protein CYY_002008 [Polysphondylium violaceum]
MAKDSTKRYTNSTYGFSISYPKKWNMKENISIYLVSFFDKDTTFGLNVVVQDLKELGKTQSELLEISKEQVIAAGAQDVETGKVVIGGHEGNFLQYYAPDIKSKYKQCFFILNGMAYIIIYHAPFSQFRTNLAILEKACETFEIFKAKGFKTVQLKCETKPNKSLSPDFYIQYWYPKVWSVDSANTDSNISSYQDKANSIFFSVRLEPLRTTDTVESFGDILKDTLKNNTNSPLVPTATSLANDDIKAAYYKFTENSNKKQECMTVYTVYKNYGITLNFSVPEKEMIFYNNIFNRIIKTFKISALLLETPVYNRFENLISKYSFHIPSTFSLTEKFSTGGSLIFQDDRFPNFPIFNLTLEDLGRAVTLEEYQSILLEFYNNSISGSRIISQDKSRIDKYKAAKVIMEGVDMELGLPCKVYFKCAVVKRSKGILLNIRVPVNEFPDTLKKSFFIFDSLTFH